MRFCTVCVRAGSKGLRDKNMRLLAGLPLYAHSLQQAVAVGLFDAIIVSTDSERILESARGFGATHVVRRPRELASDTAPKLPAIVHAVAQVESALGCADVVVDLDATSPLRTPDDITTAVDLLAKYTATSVITGTPSHRSPYFNMVEEHSDGSVHLVKETANPIVRRQDAPPTFDMNASIYVWVRDALMTNPKVLYPDTRLYSMPPERSVDIDSELDFRIVEMLMHAPHLEDAT